jgi:hypothetical protein
MARRPFSIFVSEQDGVWRVVSVLGERGPFATRATAMEAALHQAALHRARQVLVQSNTGAFQREWPLGPSLEVPRPDPGCWMGESGESAAGRWRL